MEIKCADLPGVGRKHTIRTADGRLFVIITHQSGRREVYFMGDLEDDEPLLTFEMNDDEARKVGAILLGADYQPVSDERVDTLLKNFRIEWIPIAAGSELSGQRIMDSRIRTATGATIIGIQRGETMIGSPDVQEVLHAGDVLMAVGKREQIKALEKLCQGQGR